MTDVQTGIKSTSFVEITGGLEEGDEVEGNVTDEVLEEYCDPESEKYSQMVEKIRERMKFTSLQFNRLDDMIKAVGIDPSKLCTYCWNGKEGGSCGGCCHN